MKRINRNKGDRHCPEQGILRGNSSVLYKILPHLSLKFFVKIQTSIQLFTVNLTSSRSSWKQVVSTSILSQCRPIETLESKHHWFFPKISSYLQAIVWFLFIVKTSALGSGFFTISQLLCGRYCDFYSIHYIDLLRILCLLSKVMILKQRLQTILVRLFKYKSFLSLNITLNTF